MAGFLLLCALPSLIFLYCSALPRQDTRSHYAAQEITMPSPHDEQTLELAEALRRSVSTFVRQVRVATSTARTSQLETLELLETRGAITIAELARLRGVKHQSMRLVIQELESQQFITRQPNAQDARAQLIALTETARSLLNDAREQRARWIADLLTEKLDVESRDDLIKGLAALNKLVG